ncbi:hypothetical protein D3C75_609350 [compost metagenome]
MLVLSHTYSFRIDLHQLRQRVLHTAGDRSRAALRYIQIREFLLRQLGSRIDTRSRFINDQVRQLWIANLGNHFCRKLLRFTRACAIADYDELNAVLSNQLFELSSSFALLVIRRRRIGHGYL